MSEAICGVIVYFIRYTDMQIFIFDHLEYRMNKGIADMKGYLYCHMDYFQWFIQGIIWRSVYGIFIAITAFSLKEAPGAKARVSSLQG